MECISKSPRVCASITLLRRLGSVLLIVVLTTVLVGPLPAGQASPSGSISVTTTEDEWDEGTECSLREAVQAANKDDAFGGCPAGSGADVIELPAGTYTLTRAGNQDDLNASGDLDLDSDITINGVGQATTIIDGDERDRVLHILDAHTVTLNDLTIIGGHAPDGAPGTDGVAAGAKGGNGGDGADGGGIFNKGTLTLNRCTVRDCRAGDGGFGGAGQKGQDGASAGEMGGHGGDGGEGGNGGYGGGVFCQAPLALNDSVLEGNHSGKGGKGGAGGAGGQGAAGDTSIRDGASGGDGGDGGDGGLGLAGGGIAYYFVGDKGVSVIDSVVRDNHCGEGGTGGAGGAGGEGGQGYSGALTGDGGEGGAGGDGGSGDHGGAGAGMLILEALTVTGSLITLNRAGAGGGGGAAGVGGKGGDGGDASGGIGRDGGDAGYGGRGGNGGHSQNGGDGGGIIAGDAMTVTLSTISLNEAGDARPGGAGGRGGDGGHGGDATVGGTGGAGGRGGYGRWGGFGDNGGHGGGIVIDGSSKATSTLLGSTISGNATGIGSAGGQGGAGGDGGQGGAGAGPDGENGNGSDGGRAGVGGWGGGVRAFDRGPLVLIEDCTVSGNSTGDGGSGGDGGASGAGEGISGGDGGQGGDAGFGGRGAGLYLERIVLTLDQSGPHLNQEGVYLVNTTVSGNRSGSGGEGGDGGLGTDDDGPGGAGGLGGPGGGIYAPSDGVVAIANCTIAGNRAEGAGGQGGSGSPPGASAPGGQGGGIRNMGTVTMTHTILAGNSALDAGPDCYEDLSSDDFNLIESVQDCTVVNPGHDIVGVGPDLLPLADNGGDTETHALLPISLALDGGDTVCYGAEGAPLTVDQRGAIRPMDGDGSGGALCEIGAVEMQGSFGLAVTVVGEGEVDSEPAGIDCGGDCGEDYWDSTVVTLTATADTGSSFVGWSGDCDGADPVCVVRMYASREVTATFGLDLARVYLPTVLK